MLFAVVRLCMKGRRLRRAEIAAQPHAIGNLLFVAPPQSTGASRDPLKRPTRIAELRGEPIGGIQHTIIPSLMESVVAKITESEMVSFCFEWEHRDDVLHEYSQGRLVRHVAEGEKRMRRGQRTDIASLELTAPRSFGECAFYTRKCLRSCVAVCMIAS